MEVAPRYKLPPLLKLLKLLKKLWSKKASIPVSYTIWLCCCMGSEQKTGDDCYAYQNTCNVFKVCMGRTEQPYVCSFEAGSSRKLHNSPPSAAMGGTESAQKAELLLTRDSIPLPTLHQFVYFYIAYIMFFIYICYLFCFKEIHFHC